MKAADTLTVPEVPMDRWFICWVRGPIMLAGCMEMVWSMAGVITAPYTHVQTQTHTVTGQTAWRTGEEMSYHSTIHLDDFIRVNGLITQPCSPHKTLSFFHSSHWPVQPQLGPIMRARRELFHFNKWNNAIQMRVMHTSAEMMHRSLNSRAAPHRGCVYVSGTLGWEC